MPWAARRRLVILIIIGAVAIAFFLIVLISTFYKTSSCTDGVQNQDEAGIDCGGPCAYLCTEQMQAPTVLFTKALDNGSERTDVVAMVENKNTTAAAKNVPYRITLYGIGRVFLKTIDGTLDLFPNARTPVYVRGVASNQKVASAFLEIETSSPRWFTMTSDSRIVPMILNVTQSGATSTPRIEAALSNSSAATLSNIRVIALVKNAQKDVIAASETIVPSIFAQGQSTAIFTWNNAFIEGPSSIEVVPMIPLPAQAGLP
ncbi:MAG: hypothetical protein V1685_01960 [Parcubacteria group bacterium]